MYVYCPEFFFPRYRRGVSILAEILSFTMKEFIIKNSGKLCCHFDIVTCGCHNNHIAKVPVKRLELDSPFL